MAHDVSVAIGGDNSHLKKTFAQSERIVASAGQAMSSSIKAAGFAMGAGLAAATVGFYALSRAAGEFVSLANVQEEAEAKLSAVLRATGNAAGYTADELKTMASAMQEVTTVGDEVIISGMGMLATFRNIKGEAFQEATKAALDMSAAMGQDLKSSIVQIGKALNDPIQGLTALSRVGVTFTDQQKEQIKTMQLSGDVMGAQKVILAELKAQFGGVSEAMRQTFGGSVTAMSNAFGDLKEELGFIITKNSVFIESVQYLEQVFVQWGGKIKENRQLLIELAQDAAVKLVGGIGAAVETLRFFHNGWLGIRLVGTGAVAAIATGLDIMFAGVRNVLVVWDTLFSTLVKVGAIDVNPFDKIEQALGNFKESSRITVADVVGDIEKVNSRYDKIGNTIKGLQDKVKSVTPEFKDQANVAEQGQEELQDQLTKSSENITKQKITLGATKQAFGEFGAGAVEAVSGVSVAMGSLAYAEATATEGMDGYKTAMANAFNETELQAIKAGDAIAQLDGQGFTITPVLNSGQFIADVDNLTQRLNNLGASANGAGNSGASATPGEASGTKNVFNISQKLSRNDIAALTNEQSRQAARA